VTPESRPSLIAGRRTTASIGKAEKLRYIAEKVIGLPTLPTVVSKMMELVDNPRTSARSLASLIQSDQVLTAKILKLSNSVYYGRQRQVATVDEAIVVMGFEAVKDMGLSVSVLEAFKSPGENRYFDLTLFWEHAISVGVGSQMLCRTYQPRYNGESFTAGLLHDLGKVVINQYCHDDFLEIMDRVHLGDEDLLAAETTVLATTHDRIGGWLANKWNLPYPIVEAIEFHHQPFLAEKHRPLAALVHLSDYLGRIGRVGVSGNKKDPVLTDDDRAYYATLNIPMDEPGMESLLERFFLHMEQATTFIDVIQNRDNGESFGDLEV
jgi:HD-like signal output (HDOD) protein